MSSTTIHQAKGLSDSTRQVSKRLVAAIAVSAVLAIAVLAIGAILTVGATVHFIL